MLILMLLTLSGIEPNSVPTTISAALGINDNNVSVCCIATIGLEFPRVESHTGAGYAQINGEIIYYTFNYCWSISCRITLGIWFKRC